MPFNTRDIHYVPSLIANLVFGSSFFKNGFYFYVGNDTLNRISDDQEVVYTPMVNGLFALQVVYIFFIALLSGDFTFMRYQQL